jgi:hypothetical protein
MSELPNALPVSEGFGQSVGNAPGLPAVSENAPRPKRAAGGTNRADTAILDRIFAVFEKDW